MISEQRFQELGFIKYQKLKLETRNIWVTSREYMESGPSARDNSFVKINEVVDRYHEDHLAGVDFIKSYSYVQILFYFKIGFGSTSKLLALCQDREVLIDSQFPSRQKIGITLLSELQEPRVILPSSILYPVGVMKTGIGSILIDPKSFIINDDD
jgi:hypothetical protein